MKTVNIHSVYSSDINVSLESNGQFKIEFTGQRTFGGERIKFRVHTYDFFFRVIVRAAIKELTDEIDMISRRRDRLKEIGHDPEKATT